VGNDQNLDLSKALEAAPKLPDSQEPSITFIGYRLTLWVLSMMIGLFVLFFIWLIVWFSTSSKSSYYRAVEQFMRKQNEAGIELTQMDLEKLQLLAEAGHKQNLELYREFHATWIDAIKLTIQTILLPILTALLGYTFGKKSNDTEDS